MCHSELYPTLRLLQLTDRWICAGCCRAAVASRTAPVLGRANTSIRCICRQNQDSGRQMIQCEVGTCCQQQLMACQPCMLWQSHASSPRNDQPWSAPPFTGYQIDGSWLQPPVLAADKTSGSTAAAGRLCQAASSCEKSRGKQPPHISSEIDESFPAMHSQTRCADQGQCCAAVLVNRQSGPCHNGLLAAFVVGRCSLLLMDCPPPLDCPPLHTSFWPSSAHICRLC